VAEIALEPWSAGPEFQSFVNLFVQGLPLRQPSPVDGTKIRRLLVERSGGITLSICRALERAGAAAIRNGKESIDFAALQDPQIWCGIAPTVNSQLRPSALAKSQA
jgi:hypothetical protein